MFLGPPQHKGPGLVHFGCDLERHLCPQKWPQVAVIRLWEGPRPEVHLATLGSVLKATEQPQLGSPWSLYSHFFFL